MNCFDSSIQETACCANLADKGWCQKNDIGARYDTIDIYLCVDVLHIISFAKISSVLLLN